MKVRENLYPSIGQVADNYLTKQQGAVRTAQPQTPSFEEILKQKWDTGTLKFSKHASARLDDRNISLSESQKERLENGAIRAGEKGIRESLVIVDELAFIVNVPNRTVITAISKNETEQNIFTNIDGAVIM